MQNVFNMTWNYRVLAHENENGTTFKVHEVYYDKYGNPSGYSKEPVIISTFNSIDELRWFADVFERCAQQPALNYGDGFPSEYEPKEKTFKQY